MSIRSCLLMMLFSSIPLLVFCLDILSTLERGVLKSPIIFVHLSVSTFWLHQFLALHILQISGAYTFEVAFFLGGLPFLSYNFLLFLS